MAIIFILVLECYILRRPVKHATQHHQDDLDPAALSSPTHAVPPPYNAYSKQEDSSAKMKHSESLASMGTLHMISHNTVATTFPRSLSAAKLQSDSAPSSPPVSPTGKQPFPLAAATGPSPIGGDGGSTSKTRVVSGDAGDQQNGYIINLDSVRRLFTRTGSSFFLRFGLLSMSLAVCLSLVQYIYVPLATLRIV